MTEAGGLGSDLVVKVPPAHVTTDMNSKEFKLITMQIKKNAENIFKKLILADIIMQACKLTQLTLKKLDLF